MSNGGTDGWTERRTGPSGPHTGIRDARTSKTTSRQKNTEFCAVGLSILFPTSWLEQAGLICRWRRKSHSTRMTQRFRFSDKDRPIFSSISCLQWNETREDNWVRANCNHYASQFTTSNSENRARCPSRWYCNSYCKTGTEVLLASPQSTTMCSEVMALWFRAATFCGIMNHSFPRALEWASEWANEPSSGKVLLSPQFLVVLNDRKGI